MTVPDQQESAVEAVESEAFAEVVESDVDKARRYLAEAEVQLAASSWRNFPPVALATAAAAIGTGYAVLAANAVPSGLVLPSGADPALVDALAVRERRVDVEARPHDGEQLAVVETSSAAPASKPAARARRPKAAGRG